MIGLLGPTKRPAVRVRVNGHTYRSTAARMGGAFSFLVSLNAENRAAAGVAGGDEVELELGST